MAGPRFGWESYVSPRSQGRLDLLATITSKVLGVANTRPKSVFECQEIMTAKSDPKPGGDEYVDEMCDLDEQCQ